MLCYAAAKQTNDLVKATGWQQILQKKSNDMTNDMIGKFIESKTHKNTNVNIHFKQRETLKGVFLLNDDYEELKEKNFWRIVSGERLEEWKRTQDSSLARIFNGADFKRLTETN